MFPLQAQLPSQSGILAVCLVVDLVAREARKVVLEDLDNTLLAGAPPQHSLVLLAGLEEGVVVLETALVLLDPLFGELAGLDLLKDLLHMTLDWTIQRNVDVATWQQKLDDIFNFPNFSNLKQVWIERVRIMRI